LSLLVIPAVFTYLDDVAQGVGRIAKLGQKRVQAKKI